MTRYRSTVRINTRTGQVDWLTVETVGANAYDAEHDAEHDRATAELGRVLDPHPSVREIRDGERRPGLPTGLTAPEDPDSETDRSQVTE
ncbi:hypothetical protein ACWEOZ_12335 [Actinoplanes sp. NPDC004185]